MGWWLGNLREAGARAIARPARAATVAALLLVAFPAAALPVFFDVTLTETSPDSAQYVGTFSIDSSVLASGKAINLASIGIDLTVAGIAFTTASSASASSLVILDGGGLAYLEAILLADEPGHELHFSNSASEGEPYVLEWDLVPSEGRDPLRSGTYSFSMIPEPSPLLCLAAGLALLGFRRRWDGHGPPGTQPPSTVSRSASKRRTSRKPLL